MTDWIFLSKHGTDQYINRFAQGSGGRITNTDDFDYETSDRPIVLRGILKHKIMQRCWQDHRNFFYMDTGYFGNRPDTKNPHGWKLWHRVVPNDLQHQALKHRPNDRWKKLGLNFEPRRHGRRIIVAVPDEKPCKFYGIDQADWIKQTVDRLGSLTDRPVIVRERVASRYHRVHQDPLDRVLRDDVHALVTFNSAAAIESVMAGVPAFVLAPTHAAAPVANRDLAKIEDPFWPDAELIHTWACHLAYGQFHVRELEDGTAYRILKDEI